MEKSSQEQTPPPDYIQTPESIAVDKIMTAEEYAMIEHQTPYLYNLKNDINELLYFGTYHSRNPEDPIFSEIENKFNEMKPDLVIIEGMTNVAKKRKFFEESKQKGEMITKEKVIDLAGESGFALMLASQKGIDCESPEPVDSSMYEALLDQGFTKDDIFAQQVFLELPQYHRQMERNRFENYIQNSIYRFRNATNWDGFDYSYQRALEITKRLLGREVDVENDEHTIDYVDPIPWEGRKDTQTELNKISRFTNKYRDRYMVGEIAKALKTHKKLFVVFGASHAVMQEPALVELFK